MSDKVIGLVVKMDATMKARADLDALTAFNLQEQDGTASDGSMISGNVVRRLTHRGLSRFKRHIVAGLEADYLTFIVCGTSGLDKSSQPLHKLLSLLRINLQRVVLHLTTWVLSLVATLGLKVLVMAVLTS